MFDSTAESGTDDNSGDSTDGSLDNSDTWEDNGEEVQQIEY